MNAKQNIQLHCTHEPTETKPSKRAADVALTFGVPIAPGPHVVIESAKVSIRPGHAVFITGPSGSGKSSALAQIERQMSGCVTVNRVTFPRERAIVDCIAPWASLAEAVAMLTACGLGEARLWLRPYDALSDGEKFRARLARALALRTRSASPAPLVCDEFCSGLHRRVSKAIAFNLRKLATARKLAIVVAASTDDCARDLQPDTIVRLTSGSDCSVEASVPRRNRVVSFRHRLRIVTGGKRDYDAFSAMHYRASDELGFVDKVFLLRDGLRGEPLGIVVYSHPPLELSLRNQATSGWFSKDPSRVNNSLRILRRLVVHPDVRGCGLGHHLVRRTLPRVGTEFVECLATMGEFNPVFEKAGMTRIGQYEPRPNCTAAVEELIEIGVDPCSRDFVLHVCRKRKVRQIVARVVYDWYGATTAGGEERVQRQSPELLAQTFRGLVGARPVYYLWRRDRRRRLRNVA